MYPTYVTVHLTGRKYIKRRGTERSLALAIGPDVSTIDMWGPIVIDKAVRGMQKDRMARSEKERDKVTPAFLDYIEALTLTRLMRTRSGSK